jgi:hypothetical protein
MNRGLIFRAVLIWLLQAILAIFNGLVRDLVWSRWLEELAAHQVSSVVMVALIFAVTWWFLGWEPSGYSRGELVAVGVVWVVLTVLFEAGLFIMVSGMPGQRMLFDYNLFRGRLFAVVLLAELIAPSVIGWRRVAARSPEPL